MSGNRRIVFVSLLTCSVVIFMGLTLTGCPSGEGGDATATTDSPSGGDEAVLAKIRGAVVLVENTMSMPDGSEIVGTGSGFCINNQGRIITNAHVVSPVLELEDGSSALALSRTVEVTFNAGTDGEKSHPAAVVRENPEMDLALLKIEAETPQYLDLADSETIPQLAKLIACGHPLGLREISLRPGVLTARRTLEGRRMIEHDAEADNGNSGGPIVDERGDVVGVHTWTRISANMSTKFAIPANDLRDWLRSDPATDPPVYFASAGGTRVAAVGEGRPEAGATTAVEDLLKESGLSYSFFEGDTYAIEYENDATVYVHQWDNYLHAYVIFGELTEDAATRALAFTYHDPVGRFGLRDDDDGPRLLWEAQVPMSVIKPEYVRELCDVGASQVENFLLYLQDKVGLETPTDLYPGGDNAADYATLDGMLKETGLTYEVFDEENYKVPFDNDVVVYVKAFNGVAYIHSYTGGIPGDSVEGDERKAEGMLRFNWQDPLGRLALDGDYDVVWECQVPMKYMSADYLYVICNVASERVAEYWDTFGKIPFNSERFGES